MPLERQQLAMQRACKEIGREHWYEGKTLCIDGDPYDEELVDAFGSELQKMVFEDALYELEKDGFVTISANENGELTFALTEKGKAEAEDLLDGLE